MADSAVASEGRSVHTASADWATAAADDAAWPPSASRAATFSRQDVEADHRVTGLEEARGYGVAEEA